MLLLQQLSNARKNKWVESPEKLDITHSGMIAGTLSKNADPKDQKPMLRLIKSPAN